MKKELISVYINRFGVEALKRIAESYILENNIDELFEIIKTKKAELVKKIIEETEGENKKIGLLLMDNFSCYHQHVFLYKTEKQINLSELTRNINKLTFSGFKGDETKFAHSDIQDEIIRILLFVPFKISFHVYYNEREERQFIVLHTPVLIKIFPKGMIISIMTFTKNDWATFLPPDVVDSRSHYKDNEALNFIQEFITKNIYKINLFTLDFTDKSKELLKLKEIDLFSATKIEKCESRHRALLDASSKRELLKEIVPEKVDEIIRSPIITNLEIIFIGSAFGLPKGTHLILYPSVGSIRITKHIEDGDLNEIQDYLFS
jgi:hypothetical protein